jgi:hypothetical protein
MMNELDNRDMNQEFLFVYMFYNQTNFDVICVLLHFITMQIFFFS